MRSVVIGTLHFPVDILTWFVIIGDQPLFIFRISVGQLAAGVHIAAQNIGQGISAKIPGQVSLDNSSHTRLNLADQSRPSFVQHQDHRLTGLQQCQCEGCLIFRQGQFIQVAGRFAIGVFTQAEHDVVGPSCCRDRLSNLRRVLLEVLTLHLIGDARFIRHVGSTELVLQRFVDGVVVLCKLLHLLSLPGVTPPAVERTHGVGVGACHKNTGIGRQRKDILFVFQQGNRLIGRSFRDRFVLTAAEIGVFFARPVRPLEESKPELQPQHAPHGIVDSIHRHFPLFHQTHQCGAEGQVVGLHHHIDTGIDRRLNRPFIISNHMIAALQVLHIRPVGHNYPVEPKFLFQPLGKQPMIGMGGDPVDDARVHHYGECATLHDGGPKRFEVFLAQLAFGDQSRSAILSRDRHPVSKVMFQTGSDMLIPDAVPVASLEAKGRSYRHAGVEVGIFAVALPLAWPAGIPSQVHRWRKGPGDIAGPRLISRDARALFHQCGIEGSGHPYPLREEGRAGGISRAVNGIDAVDHRYARLLQCSFLNGTNGLFPHFGGPGAVVGRVEDGAYLVFPDHGVEHRRVHLERFVACI